MPRKSKGPYLYWHKTERTYLIRDGQKVKRTGTSEIKDAKIRLNEYLAAQWQPDTTANSRSSLFCEAAIMAYLEVQLPKKTTRHRFNELKAQGERLIGFWGGKFVSDIKGSTCRAYTEQSSTISMARHDLEVFRAAANHYDREYGLDRVPKFTLPEKSKPRAEFMTKSQAAKLLWAAYKGEKSRHLVRYLIIAYYTGTRSAAIVNMQWFPNTTGGYFDLERGLMYRAPIGEGKTGNKRKPPIPIPNRLLPWLIRWRAQDTKRNGRLPYVIHHKGRNVLRVSKSFRTAAREANLPEWVIPHIIRHSAITWAMQDGKNVNSVAQFFGVTMKVLEDVYWHHHPDYMDDMKAAKA